MRERLVIDMQPKRLRIDSEPYVHFMARSFLPIIDVWDVKKKREYFLIISAQSLAIPINEWMGENDGKVTHVEFWINKESADKRSKYQVEVIR